MLGTLTVQFSPFYIKYLSKLQNFLLLDLLTKLSDLLEQKML